ncbi:DNA cytosine methyltransferase [Brevibacillus sp. NPDC058079]|uniref:DNA cytosine methyltransferase n=1 Tax=Brevibacillus sp. NPDC058079 TaxID=3346330 RepID=UPI0036F07C5D
MKFPALESVNQKEKGYNVVVLCGGIGAGTLGYTASGLNVVLSVDSNEKNNMIHWINFPHIATLDKSIEALTESEIKVINSKIVDEVDVLDLYVPLRHFKQKGENQESFVLNAMRIVYRVKPKIIVIHSHGRMDTRKGALFANELLALVKSMGYQVQMEVLKASNYSVPQEKPWTFMIGVRKDIAIKPVFPEACEVLESTEKAIGDLLDMKSDLEPNATRMEMVKKYFPPGCSFVEVKRIVEENELSVHPAYYKRDRWEQPYHPLPNSTIRPFHPKVDRLLTIQEAKRIQSFPDDYKCVDWKEICSSVPPLLMKQVAVCLEKEILRHIEKNTH